MLFFRVWDFVNGFVINLEVFIFFLCVVMNENLKVVFILIVEVLNLINIFVILYVCVVWKMWIKIIIKFIKFELNF